MFANMKVKFLFLVIGMYFYVPTYYLSVFYALCRINSTRLLTQGNNLFFQIYMIIFVCFSFCCVIFHISMVTLSALLIPSIYTTYVSIQYYTCYTLVIDRIKEQTETSQLLYSTTVLVIILPKIQLHWPIFPLDSVFHFRL